MANNLTMERTRKKHTGSRIATLVIIYNEVSRLNQQFPIEKRGEPFNVQTLMRIVEKYEWSRNAEEEVITNSITYDGLFAKLSASLVLWEREISRSGHNPADDLRRSHSIPSYFGYVYQYAYPRSSTPRERPSAKYRMPSVSAPHALTGPRKAGVQCFSCHKYGLYRNECPEKGKFSMTNAARSCITDIGGDSNVAAARVLFELTSEEDCHAHEMEERGEENSMAVEDVFEYLVLREHVDGYNGEDLQANEEEESQDEERPVFRLQGKHLVFTPTCPHNQQQIPCSSVFPR